MFLHPDFKEFRLASQVGRSVTLLAIRLLDVKVTNRISRPDKVANVPIVPTIQIIGGSHRLDPDGILSVDGGVRVEFRLQVKDEQASREPDAVVEVLYGADYATPKAPVPEEIGEAGLDAFARLNGLFNCWPYIRQEVDRLGSAMGLPFLLPLLRIEPKPPADAEQAVENTKDAPAKKGRAARKRR